MVSLRLWPLLLAWLLIILALLLTPRPLAGQAAEDLAKITTTPQTSAGVQLSDAPFLLTTKTAVTSTAEPLVPVVSSAETTTAAQSGLHNGPGHDCDRCADTANLPPWRRRMAEKAAAARNRYEAEF